MKERSAASREETKFLDDDDDDDDEEYAGLRPPLWCHSGGSGRGRTQKGVTSEGLADLQLAHADSVSTVPAQGLVEAV